MTLTGTNQPIQNKSLLLKHRFSDTCCLCQNKQTHSLNTFYSIKDRFGAHTYHTYRCIPLIVGRPI